MEPLSLREKSAVFATEIGETIAAVLPGQISMVSVAAAGAQRFVVRPAGAQASEQRIPLLVNGEHLASLGVQLYLSMDSSGQFLKTTRSNLAVHSVLDRTPLLRQEFDADMSASAPVAHWHVHADRGALSHLLARAHAVRPDVVKKPHDISSLHFPVGGERFRPCIEDFLEFLVKEAGVDSVLGWESAVARGREHWRRMQFRASTRDLQEEAAEVLRNHGWTVTPPMNATQEGQRLLTQR